MNAVADLVRAAARAPRHVSALDAVMGDDWGRLKLGNPQQAVRMQYLIARERGRVQRRRVSLSAEIASMRPEAVVKMIATGGAKNAQGLEAQIAYLSREGEAPLQRSERFFGAEVVSAEELVAAWGLATGRREGADRTSHFIASFPNGTDPAAAERAGRAFAERMFGSGAFGDSWDYYTAFHSDTDHPHTHVVVNRRGLDQGLWLKVSRRSEMDFDRLREVQVEVAAEEGIELVATPRLARGEGERPTPDAEYRRAWKEGRAPVAPAHDAATAGAAAVSVLDAAEIYEGDASLLDPEQPDVGAALRRIAAILREGRDLQDLPRERGDRRHSPGETYAMTAMLDAKKREIVDTFREIDATLADLPDGVARIQLEREAALAKQGAAALLPDQESLRAYRRSAASERYAGVVATDEKISEIVAETAAKARAVAKGYGLDGDAMVARYAGAAVPEITANRWARDELAERARSEAGGVGLTAAERARFEREIGEAHAGIALLYDAARDEVRTIELTRSAIRMAALDQPPRNVAASGADAERIDALSRQPLSLLVRTALTERQRERLEAGDSGALEAVATDPAEQRRIARSYLDAAARDATGTDRQRLEAARRSMSDGSDRQHDREAEARERVRRLREGRDDDDGFSL